MPGWLESFLISFFLTAGKQLAAWGYLKLEEVVAVEKKIKESKRYKAIVDKNDSTREDRRRAEDDYLS